MWRRHAQYSLGDYSAAATSFRRGLELDPTNAGLKSGLTNSEARIGNDSVSPVSGTPDRSTSPTAGATPGAGGMAGMADMLRGMGGGAGGGAGGMPDIASLLNNPMMMQMAQQMMANGGMESLMQNPSVRNMVRPFSTRCDIKHSTEEHGSNIDGTSSEWWRNALYGPAHERSDFERSVSSVLASAFHF